MYPFKLTAFSIERPFLQHFQFQGEPWPTLLQSSPNSWRHNLFHLPIGLFLNFLLILLFKYIPMMSEKYEISLIMERHHSPAFKCWILTEEGCKHPSNPMSQHCIKIIEHKLWFMRRCPPVTLNICAKHETGQPKERRGAIRQMHDNHSIHLLPVLIEHNKVCELSILRIFDNLFQWISFPLVIRCSRKHFQDISNELVHDF
mmetsp:Transcript_10647/g.21069  ORF Transcript_10647/g.21069 Transcript_10647/m.21069 type:complete len:202 (-) Transcript_10647:435-1040(-)